MLQRVVQTREDKSWKGHIGSIGDEYIVFVKERPSPSAPNQFRVWGKSHWSLDGDFIKPVPMGLKGLKMILAGIPAEIESARFRHKLQRSIRKHQR